MMRRVSSRQRLVSWDSFDAVQRELDSKKNHNGDCDDDDGDDDEEDLSSFEDAALGPSCHEGEYDDDDDEEELGPAPVSLEPSGAGKNGRETGSTRGVLVVEEPDDPSLLAPQQQQQQQTFKRKRAVRRKNTPASFAAAPTKVNSATQQPPPTASRAAAAIFDGSGALPTCLESQTDDVMVHLSTFLDLDGVRSLSQVNRRFRTVLMLGEPYLWNVQAQRLWTNLPMACHEIKWATTRSSHQGEGTVDLSKLENLALAQHPVPTKVDASIFTPCRWSRSLRSRTVLVRGSIQKELVVVPTDDPSRPAVQFVGVPGRGDRSVRADAPLPRPARLAPHHQPRCPAWRPAFLRRSADPPAALFPGDASATGAAISSAHLSTAAAPPPSPTLAKWQPFVVPTLVREHDDDLVWNVSPRLVSYFEVEILPPTAASASTDNRASGATGGPPRRTTLGRRLSEIFDDENSDDDDDIDDDAHPPFAPRIVRHSKECVAVGLATEQFSMHTRMPGWDPHSWGYHGDDAGLFHGAGTMLKRYGRHYGCGDTVGCGVDWAREQVFFTLNGQSLGVAFDFRSAAADIVQNNKKLYPVVGIDTTSLVRVNLTGPFVFDVQGTMSEQAPSVSATLRQMKKRVQ